MGNEKVRNLKNRTSPGDYLRNLINIEGLDGDITARIFNLNIVERNHEFYKLLKPFIGNNISNFIKVNLRFCPKCIENGFHSLLHQLSLVKACPFHPNEMLTEHCPNCKRNITKYNLAKEVRKPFSCVCGYNLLKKENIVEIYNSFKKKDRIMNKNILKLLEISQQNLIRRDCLKFYPRPSNHEVYNNKILDSEFLINFARHEYLGLELDDKLTKKELVRKNIFLIKNIQKSAIKNYRQIFTYRSREEVEITKKVKCDSIYFEIYMHSRMIYKTIRRHMVKDFLKKHIKCIHLNNELEQERDFCNISTAYVMWREEFEGINLQQQRRARQNEVFNFQNYKEKYTLFTKGIYSRYVEDFLEEVFNLESNIEKINITEIKDFINCILPYFLLARFSEYLSLFNNPSEYKHRNYTVEDEIPFHKVIIDTKNSRTAIYTKRMRPLIIDLIHQMESSKQDCKFIKKKVYPIYISEKRRILEIMSLRENKKEHE